MFIASAACREPGGGVVISLNDWQHGPISQKKRWRVAEVLEEDGLDPIVPLIWVSDWGIVHTVGTS